jgi:uncharacterized membrane protein SirB2
MTVRADKATVYAFALQLFFFGKLFMCDGWHFITRIEGIFAAMYSTMVFLTFTRQRSSRSHKIIVFPAATIMLLIAIAVSPIEIIVNFFSQSVAYCDQVRSCSICRSTRR